MSEVRQETGEGESEATESSPAPAPVQEQQIPSLGGADGDAGPPEPASWREDWREAFAGGDDKKLKELRRYATPEKWVESGFNAKDRVARGQLAAPEPPEGATEVELATWRQQVGIPETPEGYGIQFPAEMKPSENDKAELAAYLKWAHDRGERPSSAKNFFEFYMNSRADGIERAQQAIDDEIAKHTADLRATFPGREYRRNLGENGKGGLANDYLQQHFSGADGNAALKEVLNARLANGMPLALYAPFVKAVVNMARDVATEDQILGGDGAGGGESLDQEYSKLVAVARPSAAQRQRMTQIQEAKLAREARQGRGRAA